MHRKALEGDQRVAWVLTFTDMNSRKIKATLEDAHVAGNVIDEANAAYAGCCQYSMNANFSTPYLTNKIDMRRVWGKQSIGFKFDMHPRVARSLAASVA